MNTLLQLLRESWQIARRSPLLWGFSFILAFAPIFWDIGNLNASSNYALICVRLIQAVLYLLGILLTVFGIPYCAGMSIQGENYALKDVWNGFKVYFFKFLLLEIFCVIYIIVLMVLNQLVWLILARMIENINTLWRSINLQIIFILFYVPVLLSPYGLLFQRMGVFQSFMQGFKVFAQNRARFTLIYALAYIAYFAIGCSIIAILISNGQTISLENYTSVQKSSVYFDIAASFFYFITTPIATLAFALGYFELAPTPA